MQRGRPSWPPANPARQSLRTLPASWPLFMRRTLYYGRGPQMSPARAKQRLSQQSELVVHDSPAAAHISTRQVQAAGPQPQLPDAQEAGISGLQTCPGAWSGTSQAKPPLTVGRQTCGAVQHVAPHAVPPLMQRHRPFFFFVPGQHFLPLRRFLFGLTQAPDASCATLIPSTVAGTPAMSNFTVSRRVAAVPSLRASASNQSAFMNTLPSHVQSTAGRTSRLAVSPLS
jgi:hypothetical protein